jgi:hypothetical protein
MFEELEILFSGGSKVIAGPISPEEQALLTRSLQAGEPVQRYVRGRGERVGWMLWALTPERFLSVNLKGKRPPRLLAHAQVTAVDAVRGKWGAELRVDAGDVREVIFAADHALSDRFLEALVTYCPTVVPPPKLVVPEPPSELGVVAPAWPRAQSPVADGADSERLVEALREAAHLREKGLLTDEEYSALKRKLLGI